MKKLKKLMIGCRSRKFGEYIVEKHPCQKYIDDDYNYKIIFIYDIKKI